MKKLIIVATSILPLMVGNAQATQVIPMDLIVQGSECVGFDCSSTESFGFDTLRLKENNLRMHFNDTSASGSFPSNDWRFTFNDSSNGGASFFALDDVTAGTVPFRVLAGASNNALYVNASGNVGIGTATPVVELHVTDGDSPTLRLEQDGSSGFTPQTWDLAGNETNFFIRDVTNGSLLPFRIEPGTPGDTLYLDSTGNVGMGTATPSTNLHVRGTSAGSDVILTVQTTSTTSGDHAELDLVTDSQAWKLRSNTNNATFGIVNDTASTAPFLIGGLAQTNLLRVGVTAADTINVDGNIVATGSITPDYVFKPDYKLMSIDDHAQFMWQNSHLPKVEAAAVNDEGKPYINVVGRSQGILEELEIAHIYIERLNQQVQVLQSRLDEMQGKSKP